MWKATSFERRILEGRRGLVPIDARLHRGAGAVVLILGVCIQESGLHELVRLHVRQINIMRPSASRNTGGCCN